MVYISEILTTAPSEFKTRLQRMTYEALAVLSIPYERVETDEIVTMEECAQVDEKLGMAECLTKLRFETCFDHFR